MKSWYLVAVLIVMVPTGGNADTTSGPLLAGVTPTAKAYQDSEFDPWILKLRRAEIIAVGAFPVAYLFAGLGYDYIYYLSTGLPQANIPWPLGPGTSQWTSSTADSALQKKNLSLIGLSVALSLAVAGVDWVLGQ